MKTAHDIIRRPIITEKSLAGVQNKGYTFEVALDANKHEIKKAVEEIFKVKVDAVNTMNLQAKAKANADAEAKAEALAIAEKLKACQVKIAAKGGEGGKLFGAITGAAIADALQAQHGLTIDGKKLVLDQPIKSFGSYEVKARLGYEVSGTVYVHVIEEK